MTLKQLIISNFNKYNSIDNKIFLSNNVLVSSNNNELIVFVKQTSLNSAFIYPQKIDAYVFDKNTKSFENVGNIVYRQKVDYVKICEIKVFGEQNKHKGYGTMLIKAFEHNISKYYSKKIKIIGSFAPDNINNEQQTKAFYNKNGYSVKKLISSRTPKICKILNIKTTNIVVIDDISYLNSISNIELEK